MDARFLQREPCRLSQSASARRMSSFLLLVVIAVLQVLIVRLPSSSSVLWSSNSLSSLDSSPMGRLLQDFSAASSPPVSPTSTSSEADNKLPHARGLNTAQEESTLLDFGFNTQFNSSAIIRVHPEHARLPTPIILMSLPKSGTTSVFNYFNCPLKGTAGRKLFGPEGVPLDPNSELHYYAGHAWTTIYNNSLYTNTSTNIRIGHCFEHNFLNGRPLIQGCGNHNVWTDIGMIGKKCFYPSIVGLENIALNYPNATIMITKRDAQTWSNSIDNWRITQNSPSLKERWVDTHCLGFPRALNNKVSWLQFYERHTTRLRDFVKQFPSLTYVEVELESPETPVILEQYTGIPQTCWNNHKPKSPGSRNKKKKNATAVKW